MYRSMPSRARKCAANESFSSKRATITSSISTVVFSAEAVCMHRALQHGLEARRLHGLGVIDHGTWSFRKPLQLARQRAGGCPRSRARSARAGRRASAANRTCSGVRYSWLRVSASCHAARRMAFSSREASRRQASSAVGPQGELALAGHGVDLRDLRHRDVAGVGADDPLPFRCTSSMIRVGLRGGCGGRPRRSPSPRSPSSCSRR